MGSWGLCLFSVCFFVPWLPQSKYLFPHHILSPGGKLPCHRQKKLGQVIASRSLTNHEPRSAISFLRPAILSPHNLSESATGYPQSIPGIWPPPKQSVWRLPCGFPLPACHLQQKRAPILPLLFRVLPVTYIIKVLTFERLFRT